MLNWRYYLLIIIILLFVSSISYAEYNLDRQYPVAVDNGINADYGQFRNRTGTYKAHDGIDYRAGIGTPIYPISSGTAHIHPADDSGWGRYVIVYHGGGFETRYAHLNSISVTEGQPVTTATILGVTGKTNGGTNPKMGPHLHFGLGEPDVATNKTQNPILAGLKQPFYGELNIIEDGISGQKINLLGTGTDGTFAGENDRYQIIKPGDPVRAAIKACHRSNRLDSNPYKIIFEVENVTDPSWPKQTKEIEFDDMTNILANFDTDEKGYYYFAKPFVTYYSSETNYADYYFVKFYPTAGRYKIIAKIYSCYRDGPGDSGFHLSDPEVAEREITVGLNGTDLDWYDPNISVAWLPAHIAGEGRMAAAVKPGGVKVASTDEGPEIFYAFANNNIITTNLLSVDPNLQQKALIETRSTPEANWLVQIKNASGGIMDRISVANRGWLRTGWGAGKPAAI